MAVHHLAILAVLAAVVTRVENCDDIKVIAERNKRDWETIRLEFSTPGANNSDDGINSFFTRLNRYNAFHLVVLMERSAVLGRSEFYLRQRKLVEDILRYQVEMHAGFRNSQTNVITFAHKNSYTSFTGMDKNVFFTTSWHNVTYNPDKATGAVDIRLAYSAALEKFRTFPPTGVTRLLLVLASGEFTDSPDDLTLSTLQQLGVSVYVVQCGRVSEESQERLMGMASTPDQYGTFFEWMNASWVNGPPEDEQTTVNCGANGWRYRPGQNNYFPHCRCAWGYKGDRCQEDEDECAFGDLCSSNGECFDSTGSFSCDCQPDTCGCYCDDTCIEEPPPTPPWWVALIVTLACLVLLAVGVIIVLIVLVLRRDRMTRSQGAGAGAGAEPPRHTVGWFMQQVVVIIRTGCGHNSMDDEVWEGYQEIDGGATGSENTKVRVKKKTRSQPAKPPALPPPNPKPPKTKKEKVPPKRPAQEKTARRAPPELPAVKEEETEVNSPKKPRVPTRKPDKLDKDKNKITEEKPQQRSESPNLPLERAPTAPNRPLPNYLDVLPGQRPIVEEVDDDAYSDGRSEARRKVQSDTNINRNSLKPFEINGESGVKKEEGKTSAEGTGDDKPEEEADEKRDSIAYDTTEGIYVPRPPSYMPDLEEGEELMPDKSKNYENVLECKDMELWSAYLLNVLYTGRLEFVCIMRRDQCQHIASDRSILLSQEDFRLLDGNITDASVGLCFAFKNKYYIIRAAGKDHFVAVHDQLKEVLCAVRNEMYVVVGKRSAVSERSKIISLQNVRYIVDYLK